jgi:hypothetical protein
MKFANNGKTTVCGEWTSKIKTHFRVSIVHCSDNDKFNKKYGKMLSRSRFNDKFYIVLPAKYDYLHTSKGVGLKGQLEEFLYVNC